MGSSEEKARELLRKAWATLDVVDPNALITDEAFQFLAASEQTDLERLRLMVTALEGSERGFSKHYFEQGDDEAARDCTMKANGMGKILDVIADQFGVGEEGDAE